PLGRDEGATRVPMTTGEHHATDEGSHHGADEAPHTGQTGRAPRSLHRNAGELAQRRYRTEVRSTLGGHPLPRRRGGEMDRRRRPTAVAVNRCTPFGRAATAGGHATSVNKARLGVGLARKSLTVDQAAWA